jgi:hypothetical protein
MYGSSSSGHQQQQKRSYNGLSKTNHNQMPELTQASNLDISREDILEMLNSSSNDKFLIKWSNNYSEQMLNNQLMKVKPIIHTKIVDYFASVNIRRGMRKIILIYFNYYYRYQMLTIMTVDFLHRHVNSIHSVI